MGDFHSTNWGSGSDFGVVNFLSSDWVGQRLQLQNWLVVEVVQKSEFWCLHCVDRVGESWNQQSSFLSDRCKSGLDLGFGSVETESESLGCGGGGFGDFFGGSSGRGGRTRANVGSNIRIKLKLTFSDIKNGVEKKIKYRKLVVRQGVTFIDWLWCWHN